MDLWIRSQDKMNLVKVNQINVNYQNNKQIIANTTPDFYNSDSLYYELLGTYETKERALEVLNEIQKIIKIKTIMVSGIYYHLPKSEQAKIFDLDDDEMCVKLSNQILAYEMPEK